MYSHSIDNATELSMSRADWKTLVSKALDETLTPEQQQAINLQLSTLVYPHNKPEQTK